MNILCNDQPAEIQSTSLNEALLELGYTQTCIATALNGEFVPRGQRCHTQLKTGDRLDVVSPMQGG